MNSAAQSRGRVRSWAVVFAIALIVCSVAVVAFYQLRKLSDPQDPRFLYEHALRQIHAVQRSDYASAYSQASTSMRNSLSLSQFTDMLDHDYAAMVHCTHVEFGPALLRRESAWLKVYLVEPGNRITPCIYQFLKEPEGWRIDAISVLPTPDPDALHPQA
jgi:hypothetical protein